MAKNIKTENSQASFDNQLVLFRYMLSKIGVSSLKELANPLKESMKMGTPISVVTLLNDVKEKDCLLIVTC